MEISRIGQRAAILRGIREFFWARDFLEVETPVVLPYPSQEPYLEPLRTVVRDHRGKAYDGFLRMSPEFSIKKLIGVLAGSRKHQSTNDTNATNHSQIGGHSWIGAPGVFELGPVFRDGEPWGGNHNPEFTLLEWYELGVDYQKLMATCEELITHVVGSTKFQTNSKQIPNPNGQNNFSPSLGEGEREGVGHSSLVTRHSSLALSYQGQRMDLTPPWERLTMRQAWQRHAHLDLDHLLARGAMATACRAKGYTVAKDDTFDDLFFKIHLTEVEPKLGRAKPTFLTDWPSQMAALARRKRNNPRYAERVELYIGGLELANGFSELTDADEQLARFKADQLLRKRLGKSVYPIDKDFIAALRYLPPCAGMALGMDRLVMLLTDAASIDEVRWLPAPELFGRYPFRPS